VRTGQEILGVLSIFRSRRSHAGFQQDTRLLTMVGSLIGQAMALERAVNDEHERLLGETRQLAKALKGRYKLDNVVGVSKRMQEVFAEVHQVGPSRSTVLLRGESGTGKEVIARSIHELSPRKNKPFIKVNCAALTESLLESELFGHEKGAYTGAVGERRGRFELADGGTLFLDEIGDISPAFQAKLLRVLQEREFERVGGSKAIKVDVRLICATNRNLEKMVAAGEFRADLYYRINVVSLFLPPLRERREDIPPLIAYFVERFNKENGRELRVSPEALNVLVNCYWPGNVRELENCIERTSTMARGEVIQDVNFPCHNNRCLTQTLHHIDKDDAVAPARMPVEAVVVAPPVSTRPHHPVQPMQPFQPPEPPERQFGAEKPESERERLVWAMEQSGWVQAKAARLLNITPRQMGYALQKYNIEVRRF
ncbi:MAG: nif-specific transcriptional activator NifA, partial [Zoogloea sp.]|nr:nif-specific transcriptional activator NifA [Zoogloea sp.]